MVPRPLQKLGSDSKTTPCVHKHPFHWASHSCLPILLRYVFLLLSFFFTQSSSSFLYISNIHTKHLYQASPAVGALINPSHQPWPIYSYGPDGFAQEHPLGRNTNVTSYHFPNGTWAVSSLSFLFYFLSILASQHLFLQPFLQNLGHCSGACLACEKP